jgi:hypothetical protein
VVKHALKANWLFIGFICMITASGGLLFMVLLLLVPSKTSIEQTSTTFNLAPLTQETNQTLASSKMNASIEDLLQKVPVTQSTFEIDFSYKLNKFTVKPIANSPSFDQDFIYWLNNSSYSAIPAKHFTLYN